jgi:phage terminase large subunit-like protein
MSNWLAGTDAIWDDKTWAFIFPKTGAVIRFGHIGRRGAQMRYESSAYQMIGFDELCQHYEESYTFMFSRLRRPVCTKHRVNSEGEPVYIDDCQECQQKKAIPLRMRATGNPPKIGDPGSHWVRNYFSIKRVGERYRGTNPNRPHIPAYLEDNPFIDQKGYSQALSRLDPVTREQIMKGDWGVSAEGRFKLGWVKRFTTQGDYILLERRKGVKAVPYDRRNCMKVMYVDPAASAKEGPGDKDIWRRQPSHTVISTFYRTPEHDLVFWDMIRVQQEVPDIINLIVKAYEDQKPEYIGLEWNTFSIGVGQELKRRGLPIKGMSPNSGDKVTRATPAMVRMEGGKIFFPGNEVDFPWIQEAEAEIFNWTGHPQETADIIDTLAYAGMDVMSEVRRVGTEIGNSSPTIIKAYTGNEFLGPGDWN